jgi:hypothetical protein
VDGVSDKMPKLATVDELYGTSSDEMSVLGNFGIPSTIRTAPPAGASRRERPLAEALSEYLGGLGCDATLFGEELRERGYDVSSLDSLSTWRDGGFYRAQLYALQAASLAYEFDSARRPLQFADYREAIRERARDVGADNDMATARAMRRLALQFDPVYWTVREGASLSADELSSAADAWEALTRCAAGMAERRARGPACDRIPWAVELTLEMTVYEFRRLADEARSPGVSPAHARRDILRAALAEVQPVYAARSLAVFLAANSAEFARALAPYDERVEAGS